MVMKSYKKYAEGTDDEGRKKVSAEGVCPYLFEFGISLHSASNRVKAEP
jgi:hypothetical protein